MPTSTQNIMETIKDKMERGILGADEANVEMVRGEGVRMIKGSIPARIRKALNNAVKNGTLGHLKKEGHKPEAYFHPNSRFIALEKRSRAEYEAKEIISKFSKTIFV